HGRSALRLSLLWRDDPLRARLWRADLRPDRLLQRLLGRLWRAQTSGAVAHRVRRVRVARGALRYRRPGPPECPTGPRPFPAVSRVVGRVSGHLEHLEPFLEQAVPVTEAALLASGGDLGMPCHEMNYGWVKLLIECRVQFDIVERGAKWEERYGLIILPEDF